MDNMDGLCRLEPPPQDHSTWHKIQNTVQKARQQPKTIMYIWSIHFSENNKTHTKMNYLWYFAFDINKSVYHAIHEFTWVGKRLAVNNLFKCWFYYIIVSDPIEPAIPPLWFNFGLFDWNPVLNGFSHRVYPINKWWIRLSRIYSIWQWLNVKVCMRNEMYAKQLCLCLQ